MEVQCEQTRSQETQLNELLVHMVVLFLRQMGHSQQELGTVFFFQPVLPRVLASHTTDSPPPKTTKAPKSPQRLWPAWRAATAGRLRSSDVGRRGPRHQPLDMTLGSNLWRESAESTALMCELPWFFPVFGCLLPWGGDVWGLGFWCLFFLLRLSRRKRVASGLLA